MLKIYWIGFGLLWVKKAINGGTATTFIWRQWTNFEAIFLRFTTDAALFTLRNKALLSSTVQTQTFCISEVCSPLYFSHRCGCLQVNWKIGQDKKMHKSKWLFSLHSSEGEKRRVKARLRSVNFERLLFWLITVWFIHVNLLKRLWCPKVRYTDRLWGMRGSMWLMKINAKVI